MAINATPPTAHDYERTIRELREYVERLEADLAAARRPARQHPPRLDLDRIGYDLHLACLPVTPGQEDSAYGQGVAAAAKRVLEVHAPEMLETLYIYRDALGSEGDE